MGDYTTSLLDWDACNDEAVIQTIILIYSWVSRRYSLLLFGYLSLGLKWAVLVSYLNVARSTQ